MLHRNVENFIGCDSSYRTASIVLYGAPFDSTTSYRPGARFGPAAMRHESYGLETYSPYRDKNLTDGNVFDSGDLELCFGSSESALVDIESRAAEIFATASCRCCWAGNTLSPWARCVRQCASTRICTLCILTPTPICGTITSAHSSATPACYAAATI